ncbi:galactonate dehydratase [soil metagenome]
MSLSVTRVSTVVVNARLRNWVFVKVESDQPGLVGWGEASLEWKTRAVMGAVEDLAPLIVGEDPRRTEHLWQSMLRHPFFPGGMVGMSALSGIDQAIHDIKAKDLGLPLFELLGGSVRDHVRMYDHLGGGDSDAVYNEATEAFFAERAVASIQSGFDALKILAVPRSRSLEGMPKIRQAVGLMRAVREAVGDDVDVMVDLHGRTSTAMGIQYGLALAPLRPWFLEEPCRPDDTAGLAEVARAVPVPIAAGERLATLREFESLFRARAVAVAQPDVCHAGGVTGVRRIAALAEAAGVTLAPHNPLGPVATMVNLHLGFAIPDFLIQEVMRADVPWRHDVVDHPLEIVRGRVPPPARPGIGIEVDEREAAKHPYQPEELVRWYHADDSVADW